MKWLALPLALFALLYAAIGSIGHARQADGDSVSVAVDVAMRLALNGIGLLAAFGAGLVL